jgi:hypothetical protein
MLVVGYTIKKRCFHSILLNYQQRQQQKLLGRTNCTAFHNKAIKYITVALSTFIGTTWIQKSAYIRAYSTSRMSSASRTIRDKGTITVSPKNDADQSALIVISHGLGDSAEGFVDVAEVNI